MSWKKNWAVKKGQAQRGDKRIKKKKQRWNQYKEMKHELSKHKKYLGDKIKLMEIGWNWNMHKAEEV